MNRTLLLFLLALGSLLGPLLSWPAEPFGEQSGAVADTTDASWKRIQVYCELQKGYESLADRYAANASLGKDVDETEFLAAERKLKEEIAARHRLTVLQVEQIAEAMAPNLERHERDDIAPLSWWNLLFIVANIPTCLLIGRIVFGSWDGLWRTWSDSCSIWPDAVDHYWAKAKMAIFFVWTLALLAAEYCMIQRLFP